jgi:glucokinase
MMEHAQAFDSARRTRNGGFVIGVDIGATNLRVALATMNGSLVGKWRGSTKETFSPKAVIEQICSGVDALLAQCSVRRQCLRAIAVGAPGVTDAGSGVVIATSYLRGWRNVPLRRFLESALGIPAALENDVKLAAIGEHWRGAARGFSDFGFFAIGTGIAAGIFLRGELLRGVDGAAGEVGYLIVPGTSVAPARPGTPGPLEAEIGGEGIRQQWQRLGDKRSRSKDLRATEIFDLARRGNRNAKNLLQRSARTLAYAVYNLSLVLNPSLFVLGGGVGRSRILLAETKSILKQYSQPTKPKLVLSTLGEDAQLLGSIRLALDRAGAATVRQN